MNANETPSKASTKSACNQSGVSSPSPDAVATRSGGQVTATKSTAAAAAKAAATAMSAARARDLGDTPETVLGPWTNIRSRARMAAEWPPTS